jgi:hypothetical protein
VRGWTARQSDRTGDFPKRKRLRCKLCWNAAPRLTRSQSTRARSCDWVVSNRFTQSVSIQTLPDRSTATDALPESISWYRSTERQAAAGSGGWRSGLAGTSTPARTLLARVRFNFE